MVNVESLVQCITYLRCCDHDAPKDASFRMLDYCLLPHMFNVQSKLKIPHTVLN